VKPAIVSALAAVKNPSPAVAVDFETYYDSECSVKPLGGWAYCRHPKFSAYLVSIYSTDVQFVGRPEDAPWEKIAGRVWLSHNVGFDRMVFERLVEQGKIPAINYATWYDTADLAAWLSVPRNLAGATFHLLGIHVTKELRDVEMKGKVLETMDPALREAVLAYAMDDAALCWLLWTLFQDRWPEHEKELSLHTQNIPFRGIPCDVDRLERDIKILKQAKWVTEQSFPWLGQDDENGKPYALTSQKAMAKECVKAGVPVPTTTSIKSSIFQEWLDEYGDMVPAISAVNRWRRINRALAVYEAMKTRLRPDGRMDLALKYFGAQATGRWSGTAGVNLQNLQKTPMCFDAEFQWLEPSKENLKSAAYVVDARAVLVSSPGHTLAIPDLSQIEPRVLNWVLKNVTFLELCAQGMSPYEAHARAFMGWTGGNLKKESPKQYALAKARVLALGYGAGWQKFIEMAKTYIVDSAGNLDEETFNEIFGAPTTEDDRAWFLDFLRFCEKKAELNLWEELDELDRNIWTNSYLQVMEFRRSNASNKELWGTLNNHFQNSVVEGTFELGLPSGRSLIYTDISRSRGWTAKQGHGAYKSTRVYGGLLCENLVQATARDVFALGILRLEAAGYKVLFHVHDEYVIDVPPDADPKKILELITIVPDWAKSLPVAAEVEFSPHYKK
jgi:DNA polymerase I-like protein with 3'-5' exonuclease and polymerase domains